jgi:hypothetical protein
MEFRATRRELASAAASAALTATGLVAAGSATAAVLPPQTEPQVLSRALLMERLVVRAYRLVLGSGKLEPGVARTLAGFLAQEVEHLSAVASRLSGMGLAAPTGALDLHAADALLAKHEVEGKLTKLPRTQGGCLVMLVDIESLVEGAYFNGLRDLHRPDLIQVSAEIMSCEAQHWTVLMELLNPGKIVKAVPWPFVLGTS